MKIAREIVVLAVCSLIAVGNAFCEEKTIITEKTPAEEFVIQDYPQGIPCVEAAELGEEAVPELVAMLNTSQYEEYWPNITVALGCIGDPAAVEPLKNFLQQHKGEISFKTFSALQSVPTALGFLSEGGDEKALNTLKGLIEDDYWQEAQLKVFDVVVDETIVKKSLTRSTIAALGYSGRPEAIGALKMMKDDSQLNAEYGADIDSAINP